MHLSDRGWVNFGNGQVLSRALLSNREVTDLGLVAQVIGHCQYPALGAIKAIGGDELQNSKSAHVYRPSLYFKPVAFFERFLRFVASG